MILQQMHIIERLTFDLRVGTQDKATDIHNRISSLCRDGLPAVLDDACSSVSGEQDGHVRLDIVTIDLGDISLSGLETEIMEKVKVLLPDKVSDRLNYCIWQGRSRTSADTGQDTAPDRVVAPERFDLELLRYFLETGMLPWWAGDEGALDISAMLLRVMERTPGELRMLLFDVLQLRSARERLIRQFPEHMLLKLIEELADGQSASLDGIFTDIETTLETVGPPPIEASKVRQYLWDAVFFCLSSGQMNESEIIKAFVRTAAKSEGVSVHEILHHIHWALKDIAPDIQADTPNPMTPGESGGDGVREVDHDCPRQQICEEADELLMRKTYVSNAGLVLIWPYLGGFFDNCGLLDKGKFRDEAVAGRAALLLQYLVEGEEDTPEYLLALNKLLCGLDMFFPVERFAKLTSEEKSEADDLLRSVIKHWTSLRNTSVDGFRRSFLQRRGSLQRNGQKWVLQVERQSYDMLLESLPWSIVIVKLSWMKDAIFVEW